MKNSTLLLVDDDLAVLAALTNVLRSKGHVVIDASNGKEALEFAAGHPEIELVLLDLNMPRQNGWEVLQQLKLIRPLVPVVIITALPDQYREATAAGVAALLEKPLDIPLLLETIDELRFETPEQQLCRLVEKEPAPRYVTPKQQEPAL